MSATGQFSLALDTRARGVGVAERDIAVAGRGRRRRRGRARGGREPSESAEQHTDPGRVPAARDQWREPLRAQRDPLAEDLGRVRSNRDERAQFRKQSWLGRFVSTYGWRAYALPILAVVTVVVIYQTIAGPPAPTPVNAEGPVQAPVESPSTEIVGAPPKGLTQFDANLPTGILPGGGPFTEAGAKTWHIVPGTTPKVGQGTERTFTYTVEVEDGLVACVTVIDETPVRDPAAP